MNNIYNIIYEDRDVFNGFEKFVTGIKVSIIDVESIKVLNEKYENELYRNKVFTEFVILE